MTNHLWQSTLFAVVVALLALALRKNRAQVRYWVWFSASLKFFVPFALLISLGSHLDWAPVAKKVAPPAVTFAVEQIAQPFPNSAPIMPSTSSRTDWTPMAVIAVWACGSAAIALIRFRSWLRIRAVVRSSIPIDIPASVEVRSSPALLEPGVVGLLRPVLLLPEGIEEHLTPRQLEAVLAHELCHVHRRDNLFASIHMIVEAMFWFHPLVWWIGSRLVEERERACDEQVLSLGSEPRVYAEGILNVCKLYAESPLACVSGVTGSGIKKRIEAIMKNRIVLRLNFAKKMALIVSGAAAIIVPVLVGIVDQPSIRAQSAAGVQPKFEVASIRPCEPTGAQGRGGRGGEPAIATLRLTCTTVIQLIHSAYDTSANGRESTMFATLPISGGPSWVNTDRYTINAKAEGTPPRPMMMGPMLRTLLEDRFQLKMRRETREVPVYLVTVAKGGPKLKASQEGTCPTPGGPGGVSCPGSVWLARKGSNMTVDQQGTIDDFVRMLIQRLDRPVIDKTGIKGMFDFHLEFAPDEAVRGFDPGRDDAGGTPPATLSDPAGGPSIFTAIQEQLGLKLESARGPGEFLVIDHIEKPSEN